MTGKMVYSHLAGREVDSGSEEHRHECECRWLLTTKPTRSQKHLHLYGVVDRQQLFGFDPKTGRPVLAADHTSRWAMKSPLMKFRGLEAADHLLAEAKRLHDLMLEGGVSLKGIAI